MIAAAVAAAILATATGEPERRVYVSVAAGGQGYLSQTRTMGGIGPAVGFRLLQGPWLAEADAAYLFQVGNVLGLRAGAGVQRRGFYAPSAVLSLGLLLGDRFSFYQPGVSPPGPTPTITAGAVLSPLRFAAGRTLVSVLQLGVGIGTELPGFGAWFHLGLLEVAVALD